MGKNRDYYRESPWRRAALLLDRERRAIRDRARAGEPSAEIAQDYGVRVEFVEFLAAWQLSEEPIATCPDMLEADGGGLYQDECNGYTASCGRTFCSVEAAWRHDRERHNTRG
jgi:hypothetical protein